MTSRRSVRLALTALALATGVCGFTADAALAAAPETPETRAATSVTATTATLNGVLNPHAEATAGYQFEYVGEENKVPHATCEGGETTSLESEATGKAIEVSTGLTFLAPNREYTFCVIATHQEGETVEKSPGPSLKFKTLKAKPLVIEESTRASEVTPFSATLEAELRASDEPTNYSITYATNEALTEHAVASETHSIEGNFPESARFETGRTLIPSTTYFYRVTATNGTGTTQGPLESFTTLAAQAPAITEPALTALNSSEPRLSAKINPEYQETSYAFEYATSEQALTEGQGVILNGKEPLSAVSQEISVGPVGLQNLTPGQVYFWRISAANATGTTHTPTERFQAEGTPTVITGPATETTRTSGVVSGSLTPFGLQSSYRFLYIDQSGYEAALSRGEDPFVLAKRTEASPVEAGFAPDGVGPITLSELTPGTTYRYELVAENEIGTTDGMVQSFTTSTVTPPAATTGNPEGIGPFSATVTGTVNTQGLETRISFQLGASPGEGPLLPATVLPAASENTETARLALSEDLEPGATYYYRLIAESSDGTTYGAIQSFTTLGLPAAFPSSSLAAAIPYIPLAQIDAQEPKRATAPPTPKLTRKQLFAKALKVCRRKHGKKRGACEQQARKKYGSRG